jgi:hypothetical protein
LKSELEKVAGGRVELLVNPVDSAIPSGTRLARRLNLTDAVALGLGSMIGAGIFAADHRPYDSFNLAADLTRAVRFTCSLWWRARTF